MMGESADSLRKRVKDVRKILEDAVRGVGSSERNFNLFVKGVEVKIQEKIINKKNLMTRTHTHQSKS